VLNIWSFCYTEEQLETTCLKLQLQQIFRIETLHAEINTRMTQKEEIKAYGIPQAQNIQISGLHFEA
jgi:hypothetical protein